MYSVSTAFKTALEQSAIRTFATVTNGITTLTQSDDLINFRLTSVGNFCRTVMRQLDVDYFGGHTLIDEEIHPKLGVMVASNVLVSDNFNGSFDGAKWTRTNSTQVVFAERKLKMTTLLTPSYVFLKSVAHGDFTGNYALNTVIDAGNQALASLEVYPVYIEKDTDNAYFWLITLGSIQTYKKVGGVTTQLSTESYEVADHKVFRIRETGGNIKFDVSADGETWVNKATTAVGFDITDVKELVEIGTWDNEAETTTVVFDNFNLPDTYATDLLTEYLDYGTFIVTEQKLLDDKETTRIRAYDKMIEADVDYDLTNSGDYPLTIKELLEAICTRLGWTLATATFPNDTFSIPSEKYSTLQVKFRDVLEDIAEATASVIYFGNDDQLYLRQIDNTVVYTIPLAQENAPLTVKGLYGEINSIVLARQPQEDNIAQQDAGSIATYGLNEFRIANNWLIDDDRETAITDIYNALVGIKYYPTEVNTTGLGFLEVGDRVKVTALDATEYETVIHEIEITVDGGIIERLKSLQPDKTTTNYNTAGIVGRLIKDTEIKVDKQQGQIDLLVAQMAETLALPRQSTPPASPSVNDLYLDTDDNIIYIYDGAEWQPTSIAPSTLDGYYTKDETDAQITLTKDEIDLSVEATHSVAQSAKDQADALETALEVQSGSIAQLLLQTEQITAKVLSLGGVNLLKNSVGLKGTYTEWQKFNDLGVLIDVKNDTTIDTSTDTVQNTTSNSGYYLDDQFIIQTIPTIVGVDYTLYCKFKKNVVLTLTINGVSTTVTAKDLTTTDETEISYTNDTWAQYKKHFTATVPNTDIKISTVGTTGYAIVSDLIVKIGDVDEWQQAPNEVYGSNYVFDKDGFSVTSLDGKFKAVMAGGSFTLYDVLNGNKIVAYYDIFTGKINQLIVQGEMVNRRYEESASSLRTIPVEDGIIEVVND